jgi:secreted trypsin-like serine protease
VAWAGVLAVAWWAAVAAPVSAQDVCPDPRRIVGGEPTDIKKHPWQVALDVEGSLCGGVLIGENWVLTAAHCFDSNKAEGVRAKAGATNFRVGGAWAPVDRVIMHEKYDRLTKVNDLALVKLKSRAPGKSIPLAKADLALKPCETLEVTGWGRTQQGKGGASDVLQKADVSYIDTGICNQPRSYGGKIQPSMMCAGQSQKDACQGDSGGPLVLKGQKEGEEVLVGIVSWGEGCGQPFKYGVYTRVSAYRDWIAKVVTGTK